MRRSLRTAAFLLALILALTSGALSFAEESGYRTLELGSKGEDVLRLKQRMYELGYFNTDKLNGEFNTTTRDRLKDLQRKNSLEPTGIATPDVQVFIFSDRCLGKKDAAPGSDENPEGMPSAGGPNPPPLTPDGYMAPGSEPYVYDSRAAGVWTYISENIHLEIRQRTDRSVPHVWLEATIRVRDPKLFTAMVNVHIKKGATRESTFLSMPTTIAEKNQAIFACSDDFFGYRLFNNQRPGIIIRNGKIWSEKTKPADSRAFPPLDVMALFEDGHMKTFVSDAHTAQEYLDMGVVSTFAFGPILVQDGEICEDLQRWSTTDRSPRMAMGMTADGTILMVDVLGRRRDAVGVTFPWLAERMKALGAVEALNLDGGNTTCMIFMGNIINRPVNTKKSEIRTLTSMVGLREPVAEEAVNP